jgi:hypothetical protein
MRTVGASLPGRLGASLLAVILCALMVLPAQAITANYPHFTPAVPVPEKTAYRGVFESDAQAYTGIFGADNPVNLDDPSGNDYGDFSINLFSIFNLLASAVPSVLLEGNQNAVTSVTSLSVTVSKDRPPDAQVYASPHGDEFLAPTGIDFTSEFNAGKVHGLWGADGEIGPWGEFDFQHNSGHGKLPSNNVLYTKYEDAGNYGVGVYMCGAGYSKEDTFSDADTFWGWFGSPLSGKQARAVKGRHHYWWGLGWDDAHLGKLAVPKK